VVAAAFADARDYGNVEWCLGTPELLDALAVRFSSVTSRSGERVGSERNGCREVRYRQIGHGGTCE
jgi:hypothetical protein